MLTTETRYKFIAAIRSFKMDVRHHFITRKARKINPVRLHIGCGSNIKKGWTNIDIKPPADIQYDVRKGLPFEDDCCEIIYSEHFLEHLEWPRESFPFLKECYRVLKPFGIINIGVPDSQFVIENCLNDLRFFQEIINKRKWGYPDYCHTAYEYINYHFRIDGHHKFAYDEETLQMHLEQVGFIQVSRREYQPEIDSDVRAFGTLYMNGIKPG